MTVPKVRRRWVVLAGVIVVLFVTLQLLIRPLTLESYRTLDPQTLVVLGYGGRDAWTRVSDLSETQSTVTVSVDKFWVQLGPGTAAAYPLGVVVRLEAPLAGRTVIDGSTGQVVPPEPGR